MRPWYFILAYKQQFFLLYIQVHQKKITIHIVKKFNISVTVSESETYV